MNPNLLLAAKKILIGLIFIFLSFGLKAQGCLPEGISFGSQSEIDNFQTNYPGCTEIEGYVRFSGDAINNLTGLSDLTRIGGDLTFFSCSGLQNLEGLNNLNFISGGFEIGWNENLENVSGLESLDSIGGRIYIEFNSLLTNLDGLANLKYIGGEIIIDRNENLSDIYGLSNLEQGTVSSLTIYYNPSLQNCNTLHLCEFLSNPTCSINVYSNGTGCNNPAEIAESCGIILGCLPYGNYWVKSQQGADEFFQNYPDCVDLKGDLHIGGPTLNYVSGLYGISSVEGDLLIQNNMSLNNLIGLESLTSVGGNLYIGEFEEDGNEYLLNLVGLENLVNFDGDIQFIGNYSLVNLEGLSGIDSVNNLTIGCLPSMIDLSGLDSLTSIKNDLQILGFPMKNLNGLDKIDSIYGSLAFSGSDSLIDLEGLSNLKYIGKSLRITYNETLSNFTGLENIKTIEDIVLYDNKSLINLHGFDSINSESINHLLIRDNTLLSQCEIENFCHYLIDLDGIATISNNAPGCDTREEVEAACTVGQDELKQNDFCRVYPNPTSGLLRFSFTLTAPSGISFEIVNCLGQKIKGPEPDNLSSGTHEIIWNASHLPDGIYLYRLQTDSQTTNGRIVLAD